ncbi:MAG: hypothetical protein GF353_25125 [Candidatus Lokiarchaeota archaeon]|nr:hypothetical protein [Candidatus Lokiarchaeota archaeon]
MKLGEGVHIVRGVLDLEETKSFYKELGYVTLDESNKPNKWILFTDGRINLLIDEGEMKYSGLIYFNPNFDDVVSYIENLGFNFLRKNPKTEHIPESAIFLDPEGFGCNLVNSTYDSKIKPDINGESKVDFGKFGELANTVKDLDVVVEFWTKLGYEITLKETEPHPWAILTDGLMVLGFHQEDWGPENNNPTLTYFDPNMDQILPIIQENGIELTTVEGLSLESGNGVAIAPDGSRIFLFKGDI